MKTLRSGLIVPEKDYYNVLEWKDAHLHSFLKFCEDNWFPTSVNDMNKEQYDKLTEYIKSEEL